MGLLRLTIVVVLLATSFSARALSDFHYTQEMGIEFSPNDQETSVRRTLDGVLDQLFSFISSTLGEEAGISIDLNYFTDMDRLREQNTK
ncbi:MAG: hypothetical protein CSB47_10970 [Proteobacteria bacterium]|nr:MAG: hypothetical protein CSB47_10970 [Pseudomonadota bacterium]